eukprot:gnl/TRDRNA2_/TRDRNA2_80136_c1_seq1.p2 gnl/TRDRNA2_/TRDRNA2_80136_c1~~gnl/TRDRNA2_/TRDRNA2_80136_c1_seq1.p2  ORF type:complete len:212 (+),score=42.02 gnl/TRDRNA2_/TRDRNA2_80136_c1_seq1:84-638(+)
MATSASAFCVSTGSDDPAQTTALAQAAQQAVQRANWAINTMNQLITPDLPKEWVANLKKIAQQAVEAAEHAAQDCHLQVAAIPAQPPTEQEIKKRVPCKWYLMLGQCRRGADCEFSHEMQKLEPRPLSKKRAEECSYFKKGQCTRGAACPFAHGAEELAEITKFVSNLKLERRVFSRSGRITTR